MSIENPVIYVPISHPADQGTNIRLRLRCSFRLLSFGYVLNDDLRLTQPIRAAHPFDEILLYICREHSTNQPFLCKTNPILSAVGGLQMNVSCFFIKEYKNFIPLAGYKNKPNSNPNKPNLRKAKMNVNLYVIEDYRKNDDFVVRINKPNSKPISEKAKMNANIFITKDYENEPLSGSKKTNPIKANFRQEMLKNALSTCLRKAPLRRHRQSYSTWNLLFRPDRRPPHLQPATYTLRNRGTCAIGQLSPTFAVRHRKRYY